MKTFYLNIRKVAAAIICVALPILVSCKSEEKKATDGYINEADRIVTPSEMKTDSVDKEEKEEELPPVKLHNIDETLAYIHNSGHAAEYLEGIIPTVAEHSPEYASKLLNSTYSRFIVVDKARMKVILYDKYGREELSYDMACARNYGTKHKKADSRTPEGFFSVEGVYDSTDWLFTDDNGRTSKKKGQFGPRFIRLKIPTTSQIGIHGTCAPWSMGHRTSHGCIRVTNEHILELVNYVEVGMPVIVLPGKRDRAVNREEGYDIAYFPTDPKYAMSDSESKLKAKEKEEETEKPDSSSNANGVPADSTAASSPVAPTLLPEEKPAKEDPVVPATEPAAPAE